MSKNSLWVILFLCLFFACKESANSQIDDGREKARVGVRPYYLIDNLPDGKLKSKLESCSNDNMYKSDFSIGHRGSTSQFPEHTEDSYVAASRMGAGILECDVTFTKDKELVCRHSQCDLHTSTNILEIPELASKCSIPFEGATNEKDANVKCCASDLTLAEFRQLKGRMDAGNPKAKTREEYVSYLGKTQTDWYSQNGKLMTHKESIELFKKLGAKFTPELKAANVDMPYEGNFSQENYAQKMVDEYKEAGIEPKDVFLQSFNLNDVLYWVENEPEFGKQAVFLIEDFASTRPEEETAAFMKELYEKGVRYVAPPLWMLVDLDSNDKIVASSYANEIKKANLNIITWTLERSGPLAGGGGGWYYQSIEKVTRNDATTYQLLDVLAQEVGVKGVFSDWPATVTYYANCLGL